MSHIRTLRFTLLWTGLMTAVLAVSCGGQPGELTGTTSEAISGVCSIYDVAWADAPTSCGHTVMVSSPDASYGTKACEAYGVVSSSGTTYSQVDAHAYPYQNISQADCPYTVVTLYSYHWNGTAWHLDYSSSVTGTWNSFTGCGDSVVVGVDTSGAPLLLEASATVHGSYVRVSEGWWSAPC